MKTFLKIIPIQFLLIAITYQDTWAKVRRVQKGTKQPMTVGNTIATISVLLALSIPITFIISAVKFFRRKKLKPGQWSYKIWLLITLGEFISWIVLFMIAKDMNLH